MFHNYRRLFFTIILLFPIVIPSSNVFAQTVAMRTLSSKEYTSDLRITVTIEVTGDPGAVTVVETPPAGWIIRSVSSGGQVSGGVITWELTSFTGTITLKYYVTPESTTTGNAIFFGRIGNQEIGGMATITPYKLPANIQLPRTTGPYTVGTFLVHLVDESRKELNTPKNPDDKRELMVQIWYPADIRGGGQPGLVYPGFEIIQPVMVSSYGSYALPPVYWDGVRVLMGNAIWNAPLLDNGHQYPILIYSHGDTGWRLTNLSLLEDLSSHGYVVIGIDHTYNAGAVLFPDGRVIVNNGSSNASLHVQDLRFVLNQLEVIPTGSVFKIIAERLDLERVGVLGVSLGGSVTIGTLQADPRFKAGVILEAGYAKFSQPVMLLTATLQNFSPLEKLFLAGGYACRIKNTTHIDFTDYPLWWRLFSLPGKFTSSVSDDPIRIARIIADYTVAFFDKTLKDYVPPLLIGPSSDYPEVDFNIIGNPHGVSGISSEEWTHY